MYLREAGLAIPSAANPDANTNNPTRRWAIAEAAGHLTREFGTRRWAGAVDTFIAEHGTLAERMNRHRDMKRARRGNYSEQRGALCVLPLGHTTIFNAKQSRAFCPGSRPTPKFSMSVTRPRRSCIGMSSSSVHSASLISITGDCRTSWRSTQYGTGFS